ncbi:serine hydroxymethyltransferase [Desulfopila sp. IMCC35008]|uniref:serine hydroxymethyltransferase n=1 Tax=Desulfopila sp. IMCC35008 TaxID=2653858 RepID=UPI0013D87DC7|nr:serine hydroxymethyltransferase [Desulfopila sp. IMCC35008]
MKNLFKDDPELAHLVTKEEQRMEQTINLIAAENHAPKSIMEVVGSILNTKAIEGYPGNRFHGGCACVDEIEQLAIMRAKQLFGAEFANVQPHSGTSANLAVYFSVLEPGDSILSMSLPHGGHLSHGHQASMTSKCFSFSHYTLDPKTELIDYDRIEELTAKIKPKMIVAGASSYPRLIDYERISTIAGEHSAFFMVDMAHLAGLVAAKVIPSPVPYADFVTFTTYKTMMGGRGGIILAREQFGKKVNHAVFPGCQGTSGVNLIAAKALICKLAESEEFRTIQQRTLDHAALMATLLTQKGYKLVTGGTENHQLLIDLTDKEISGSVAERQLEYTGLVLNRNVVPGDADHPGRVSGLRIGTAAIATRNMLEPEVTEVINLVDRVLSYPEDQYVLNLVRQDVAALCSRFPVYV